MYKPDLNQTKTLQGLPRLFRRLMQYSPPAAGCAGLDILRAVINIDQVRALPAGKRAVWSEVGQALCSPRLQEAFIERLAPGLARRFGPDYADVDLFPVPVLDGGHLLFYAAEALRGKPLGLRAHEYGFRIGLALVLTLMVFATWNDLIHLGIGSWFQRM